MSQYDEFRQSLDRQVTTGQAAKVPVAAPYSGSSLWDERWYRCLHDGSIWRLVRPDPPFRGIFKAVA